MIHFYDAKTVMAKSPDYEAHLSDPVNDDIFVYEFPKNMYGNHEYYVTFQGTGMQVNIYNGGWLGDFTPDNYQGRPDVRELVVDFGLRYILGIDRLLAFWNDDAFFSAHPGINRCIMLQGNTGSDMNTFTEILFKELELVSKFEIFKSEEIESWNPKSVNYRVTINLHNLNSAIEYIRTYKPEEMKSLRYFKRLEQAKERFKIEA